MANLSCRLNRDPPGRLSLLQTVALPASPPSVSGTANAKYTANARLTSTIARQLLVFLRSHGCVYITHCILLGSFFSSAAYSGHSPSAPPAHSHSCIPSFKSFARHSSTPAAHAVIDDYSSTVHGRNASHSLLHILNHSNMFSIKLCRCSFESTKPFGLSSTR